MLMTYCGKISKLFLKNIYKIKEMDPRLFFMVGLLLRKSNAFNTTLGE